MADFKVNGITPSAGNIKYNSQNVQQIYRGSTLVWPFMEDAPPVCVDRIVVFQICNSNRVTDDNFNVYLNSFNWADVNNLTASDLSAANLIATIDQNCNTRCANIFIGSTDISVGINNQEWTGGRSYAENDVVSLTLGSPNVTATNEGTYRCIAAVNSSTLPSNDPTHWELLFDCPISLTTQHYFDPALLRGGSNTLFFENVQQNGSGNFFVLEVKNYLLDTDTGLLTDPLTIVDSQGVTSPVTGYRFGPSNGTNFAAQFNFDSCGE